jgi:hypothetical protein
VLAVVLFHEYPLRVLFVRKVFIPDALGVEFNLAAPVKSFDSMTLGISRCKVLIPLGLEVESIVCGVKEKSPRQNRALSLALY